MALSKSLSDQRATVERVVVSRTFRDAIDLLHERDHPVRVAAQTAVMDTVRFPAR
jgi:hypothetical protein